MALFERLSFFSRGEDQSKKDTGITYNPQTETHTADSFDAGFDLFLNAPQGTVVEIGNPYEDSVIPSEKVTKPYLESDAIILYDEDPLIEDATFQTGDQTSQ